MKRMERYLSQTQFVVCINNSGYPASLEVRKIYQVIPDARSEAHQLVRVIDESGEDYLYPASHFEPVTVSPAVKKSLLHTS